MAERTEIAWCDSTFNPWIGCTRVSPACDDCYAARSTPARALGVAWGPGKARRRTATATWKQPERWNATPFFACPDCGLRGDARAMGDEPKTCQHLHAQPTRQRVFCASLADVFDNDVPPQWRGELWSLVKATPNLDWLLLTKRVGNVRGMLPADWFDGWPNVWLGATVVNQAEADRDIPKLLAVPARVRFLSIEPMLGPIDSLWKYLRSHCERHPGPLDDDGRCSVCEGRGIWSTCTPLAANDIAAIHPGLHWVITGGESGRHARPANPQWFRDIRDQCAAAEVAYLHKQHGEWAPGSGDFGRGQFKTAAVARDGRVAAGGFEWRDYPPGADASDGWSMVHWAGKKAAGRLLDGVQHDGFPA